MSIQGVDDHGLCRKVFKKLTMNREIKDYKDIYFFAKMITTNSQIDIH